MDNDNETGEPTEISYRTITARATNVCQVAWLLGKAHIRVAVTAAAG